jgi:hypothetical protein
MRATGLSPRRMQVIDAESVLVGAVRAGFNRAAETRSGAARKLSTNLNNYNHFKATIYGLTSAATGGYVLEVAHIPEGKALADALGWTALGALSISGEGTDEAVFSGMAIFKALKAATDRRVADLGTLTPGSGYSAASTYPNVALTGGTGTGVTADIVVAGGVVTGVTIKDPGKGYTVGDSLTTANANLGGAGSGFAVAVAKVVTGEDMRGQAVRATAGNGSNGASAPSGAGTIMLTLEPSHG